MNHPIAPNCWKSARAAGMALSILLAFITLIPFPLKSQQSPPQEVSTRTVEPTFKLQAERNMVTVRVVVRNKQGEAVDNLRREDFQIFDRGKKQAIVQFIPYAGENDFPHGASSHSSSHQRCYFRP